MSPLNDGVLAFGLGMMLIYKFLYVCPFDYMAAIGRLVTVKWQTTVVTSQRIIY